MKRAQAATHQKMVSRQINNQQPYKQVDAATPNGYTPWYRLGGLATTSHADEAGDLYEDTGESAADLEKKLKSVSMSRVKELRACGLSDGEVLRKMAREQADKQQEEEEVSAPENVHFDL